MSVNGYNHRAGGLWCSAADVARAVRPLRSAVSHEVLAGADPQAEILHVVHSHGLSSEGASVRDIVETVAAFVLLTVAAIVIWRGPW